MWSEFLGSGIPPLACVSASEPILLSPTPWSYRSVGLSLNLSLSTGGEIHTLRGLLGKESLCAYSPRLFFRKQRTMNWNCLWEIKATQRVSISFRSWCCHLRSPWRPTIESHTQHRLTRGTHWFLRLRGLQEGTGSTLILGRIPGNFWPTYYYIYSFFFNVESISDTPKQIF